MDSPGGGFKPPFASYDLVVYFGVGLFLVPFVDNYIIQPLGWSYPEVNTGIIGSEAVTYGIAVLSLAFIIYVVGHATAFLSGQLIQKPIETVFGKTSYFIHETAMMPDLQRNRLIRTRLKEHREQRRKTRDRLVDWLRFLFHAPMIVPYAAAWITGFFSFYHSRIPAPVFQKLNAKIRQLHLSNTIDAEAPDLDGRWFAPVRFFVINHCAVAAARMQNYFTILGLFRSLAFIFIVVIWAEIGIELLHLWDLADGRRVATTEIPNPHMIDLALRMGFYIFGASISMLAFMRFQRRYVEEAIYAFAMVPGDELEKVEDPAGQYPTIPVPSHQSEAAEA